MPNQKTYKIAELSELDSINPKIEYIPGNKIFNKLGEAEAAKPNDNRNTIYLVIESSIAENNLKCVKLIR